MGVPLVSSLFHHGAMRQLAPLLNELGHVEPIIACYVKTLFKQYLNSVLMTIHDSRFIWVIIRLMCKFV